MACYMLKSCQVQGAGSCSRAPAWRAEAPGAWAGSTVGLRVLAEQRCASVEAHMRPGVAHRRVRLMKPLGRSPARPVPLPDQQGAFELGACWKGEPVSKHMLSARQGCSSSGAHRGCTWRLGRPSRAHAAPRSARSSACPRHAHAPAHSKHVYVVHLLH